MDLLHRIARLYEDALDEPRARVRHVRARARARQRQRGHAPEPRAPRDGASTAGRRSRSSTTPSSTSSPRTPERFVELGLRARADLRGAARGRRQRDRALPPRARGRRPRTRTAVRSLDRLFTQTERWAELAQILAREAEIGQTPDEILEFKYRLGQVQQRASNDLDAAIAAYRDVLSAAPEHENDARGASKGSSRSGIKQLEIGEILEPLYRAAGEWEKLVGVHEAQLAHTPTDPASRGAPRDVLPHRGAPRGASSSTVRSARRATSARSRSTRSTRRRARRSSASPARSTAAGRRSPTRTPTSSACTQDPTVQSPIGKRLAKTFEDELGDIDEGRGDVPLRARRRGARRRSAREPRSHLPLDRAVAELADILEQRVQRDRATTLELVELYARLGQVYEERLGRHRRTRSAPSARIFDELDKTHERRDPGARAHLRAQERWTELNSVYERELENASGDVAGGGDPREDRAPRRRAPRTTPTRAIETWKRVLDLRGEDPEALSALANLYEQQQQWPELVRRPRAAVRHRGERRRRASNILTRRARIFNEQAQARRPRARGLEPRPRHRLRERRGAPRDRRHLAPQGDRRSS